MRIALLFILICAAATGQTVNVTWNFTDYTQQPQSVSKFTLTPASKYVAQSGTNILIPFPVSAVTGLNGSVTISNIVTGYFYIGRLLDINEKPCATFTNFFPTNISGAVNASAYLTNFIPAAYGFSSINPGTNISFRTNSGALFIDSTGGGGGNQFIGTATLSHLSTNWSVNPSASWAITNVVTQFIPDLSGKICCVIPNITNINSTNISGNVGVPMDTDGYKIYIQAN